MSLADLELELPDGSASKLGEHRGDPLVVVLVRYFGCLPCQQYLLDVDAVRDSLGPETNVVAVGGTADFHARWLHETKGVQMPLLLDPDQQVRAAVDLGDLTTAQLARAKGGRNYLKALFGGLRPRTPTKDAKRAPGVAILDGDLEPRWVHRGEYLGDYPTIEQLRTAIAEVAAGG